MKAGLLPLLMLSPVLAGPQIVVCVDTPEPIPDDPAAARQIWLDLGPPNGLLVQSVQLELSIEHPWVGDLRVTLTAPDGASVVILDRPGLADPPAFAFPGPHGCGGDDIDAIFVDTAAADAQSTCSVNVAPVLTGPLRPAQPLGGFEGLPASGIWTLTITDLGPTDAGTFLAACLRINTVPVCAADITGDGVLNFFDLAAYLALFTAGDPAADLAPPFGVLNFFDLSAYLEQFNAGCP